jgi:hypothetical protein
MRKILECHSQGDKRFSPFFATIRFLGKQETIERIYQTSKITEGGFIPSSIREGKGKRAIGWNIRGVEFSVDRAPIFYQTLWVFYFKANPALYEYAKTFDDFHDMFKGKSRVNQEETIRRIVRLGLSEAARECYPFMKELNDKWKAQQ